MNNNNLYSTKSGLPLSNIELVLAHMNAKIKMSEFLNKNKKEATFWFLKGIKRLSEDYTSSEISTIISRKINNYIVGDTGQPKLLYVKILIAILFSDDFKNGEEYFINLLMSLFEENSITGTIYLNSFEDLDHSVYSKLDGNKETIVYLTRPIRRYAYVADYKTIKAIKEKIIYYAKTYGIQLDRHLNISNTLLLTILLEIRKSQSKINSKSKSKNALGNKRKRKSKKKNKKSNNKSKRNSRKKLA